MCQQGAAVFFSTHVLDVAEKLCNKVAIVREGRLVTSDTMEETLQGKTSLEELFMETVENKESSEV